MNDSGFRELIAEVTESSLEESLPINTSSPIKDFQSLDPSLVFTDVPEESDIRVVDNENEAATVGTTAAVCTGCALKKARCKRYKKEIKSLRAQLAEKDQLLSKKTKTKFSVPLDCSNTVREVYRELQRDDTFLAWDTGSSSSFVNVHNINVTDRVKKEVKNLFPNRWLKGVIKEAIRRYWQSLRDDATRERSGTKDFHRMKVKRQSRLRRKLQCRLNAMKNIDWSEERKDRLRAVMSTEYMSSEESDMEGERTRTVQELTWESERLKKYKMRLDSFYKDVLISDKSRKQKIPTVRKGDVSLRCIPTDAPTWALK
ncbi:uncharacterized protein [Apostichopus japonicus]|uniref:uncharacterized protein n=1 Tax=Stichopus japonicus TaxID=307972 RepID=UPI003AB2C2BC